MSREKRFLSKIAALITGMICVFQLSANDGTEYIRAEIYYFSWESLTRSRLSLESIREFPHIKTVILDSYELRSFVRWLKLDELKNIGSAEKKYYEEDPRLVIDLFRPDGTRITYYASLANLLSEDSKKKRPINGIFRKRFSFGG